MIEYWRSFLILAALSMGLMASGHCNCCLADGFVYPLSVAVSSDGTIYVADRKLPGIWKVTDGRAEVLFRASKQSRTPLNAVRCVEVDRQGNLLAGDSATREVYRFDKDANPQALTDGKIGIPIDIAVSASGDIYVADLELHRIVKIDGDSGKLEDFAKIPAPRGVCLDTAERLWVVSHSANQVVRFKDASKVEKVVAGRPFSFPHCVAVHDKNTAFVADGYGKTIWKISPDTDPQKWVKSDEFKNPVGLALAKDKLIVADPRARDIFSIDLADGKVAKINVEF